MHAFDRVFLSRLKRPHPGAESLHRVGLNGRSNNQLSVDTRSRIREEQTTSNGKGCSGAVEEEQQEVQETQSTVFSSHQEHELNWERK
jgi:hypothetical protein